MLALSVLLIRKSLDIFPATGACFDRARAARLGYVLEKGHGLLRSISGTAVYTMAASEIG